MRIAVVDDHVVVVPAQQGEVVGVVFAAPSLFKDVVRFETVHRDTVVNRSADVAFPHMVADSWRDGRCGGVDDFDRVGAGNHC